MVGLWQFRPGRRRQLRLRRANSRKQRVDVLLGYHLHVARGNLVIEMAAQHEGGNRGGRQRAAIANWRAGAGAGAAARSGTPQKAHHHRANPGYLLSLVFGCFLPALTREIEMFTHASASLMFDPIPTFWHIAMIAVVPAVNLAAWWPCVRTRRPGTPPSRLRGFRAPIALAILVFQKQQGRRASPAGRAACMALKAVTAPNMP